MLILMIEIENYKITKQKFVFRIIHLLFVYIKWVKLSSTLVWNSHHHNISFMDYRLYVRRICNLIQATKRTKRNALVFFRRKEFNRCLFLKHIYASYEYKCQDRLFKFAGVFNALNILVGWYLVYKHLHSFIFNTKWINHKCQQILSAMAASYYKLHIFEIKKIKYFVHYISLVFNKRSKQRSFFLMYCRNS